MHVLFTTNRPKGSTRRRLGRWWRRSRAWAATIHWLAVAAIVFVVTAFVLSLVTRGDSPLFWPFAWIALVSAVLSTKET